MAPLTEMKSCLQRLICRRNRENKTEKNDAAAVAEMRTCEGQFDEHHLYLEDFIQRFPDSHISPDHPEKSAGSRYN